jgi:hypothetical protein
MGEEKKAYEEKGSILLWEMSKYNPQGKYFEI